MKKFLLGFLFVTFFVSLSIFSYKILGRYLLYYHAKKFCKEKIFFEKFYLKNRKIVVEEVKSSSDKVDFFLEKVFISKIFSYPKFLIFNPKIILKKCPNDINSLKNILEKFLKFKTEIKKGEISFLNTNNRIFFELKKNIFYLKLGDDSEIILNFEKKKESLNANFKFFEVDIYQLDHFFKKFELDIKGKLDGDVFLKYKDNENIPNIFFNFSFSNLFVKKKNYKNNFFIKKLNIEGAGKEKFSLKNFKVNGEVENLFLRSGNKIIFKDVFGYFLYDPNKKIELNFKNKDSFFFKGDENGFFINFLKDNSKIFLKIVDKDNIFVELANINYEFLDIFEKKIKEDNFRFLKGKISGNFEIKKNIEKIYFKKLEIKDVDLELKKYPIHIKTIKGEGEIERSNFLKPTFSNFEILGVQFLEKKMLLNAFFKISKGKIEKGIINGSIEDLSTEVDIQGDLLNISAEIKLNGYLNFIIKDNVKARIFCKSKEKNFDFSGLIDIGNKDKESIAFGLKFKKIFDYSFWIRGERVFLERWQKFLPCNVQGLSNIYIYSNGKDLKLFLKGENLRYQNDQVDLKIDKIGDMKDITFKDDFLFLKYNIFNKKIDVNIKKINGDFYLKNNDLKFSFENSDIIFQDLIFRFYFSKIKSLDLDLKGVVFLDFSKDKPKLDVNTYFANGKLENLSDFFKHFGIKIPKIKGGFEIKKKGFYFSKILSQDEKEFIWRGDFLLKDIKLFTKKLFFKEIEMNILSSNEKISGGFESKICVNKQIYTFSCNSFLKSGDALQLNFKMFDDLFEIFSFSAFSKINNDKFKIFIDPKSHFLKEGLNISEIILNKNLQLESLKIDQSLKISNIEFLIKTFLGERFLENILFKKVFRKNFSFNLLSKENRKNNSLLFSFYLDEKKTPKFSVKGKDFFIFNKKVKKIDCEGLIEEKNILINKFVIDDFLIKCNLFFEEGIKIKDLIILKDKSKIESDILFFDDRCDVKLRNIRIEKDDFLSFKDIKKISFEGEGLLTCFFQKNKKSFLEADLDLNKLQFYYKDIFVENNSSVNINYSNKKGLEFSKIDLNFFSDKIDLSNIKTKIKYVRYDSNEERWNFQKIDAYIPKELIAIFEKYFENKFFDFIRKNVFFEKDLELLLDLECFPKKSIFSFEIPEGIFYINKLKREIKNAKIKISPENISLEGFYYYKSIYHKISSSINIIKKCGQVILGDNLSINFNIENDLININKIKGSYLGTYFDLIEDKGKNSDYESVLFGNIKMDFSNLNFSFLEKFKFLEIGKGYQLRGYFFIDKRDCKFNKFEGEFFAKQFEIKRYIFKTLFAKVFISKDIIDIKDFKISDKSGIIKINNINLEKIDNRWKFSIPLIEAFDIRPSLIKGDRKDIKPLVITDFNIYQLEGLLDDFSSIKGKGNFHFLNSFKREQNIFEIPADVLGRILSLDSDILIPTYGDISFEIGEAKCFITKMKDVYSENKRSKFFMVDKPYMDFEGNLNIKIKMKQYVLFKLTEKFIISIQGKINKPKVHLRKKGK